MLRFSPIYFLLTLLLLGTETYIAWWTHDAIVRPYGGDYLCVICLYTLLRTFWDLPVRPLAAWVFGFACFVEVTQYFHLADRLGFTKPSVIRTLMGYSFTWVDIGCYALGTLTTLGLEALVPRRPRPAPAREASIVRTIWGRSDTVLLIFAGASAEFALNTSVDWLYFTGKLPADPLGRLFSTVDYAQQIVFAEEDRALAAIDRITAIHKGVEEKRGASIPATAYLDVLFMLIGYSISSFELLERPLTTAEKTEVFDVFAKVGRRMGLAGIPDGFADWELLRARYLTENLAVSGFSKDLYHRYRKSLGPVGYFLLLQAQVLLVPGRVRRLLDLPSVRWLYPVIPVYKLFRFLRLDKGIKTILLPSRYRQQVFRLDLTGR